MSQARQLNRIAGPDGTEYVAFACPGCKEKHVIPVSGPRKWNFNGNMERPTLSPSIKCWWKAYNEDTDQYDKVDSVCHSFVRDGSIEFLDDCTHSLKG